MNHALNEANDLQRRIDELTARGQAVKPAPLDSKFLKDYEKLGNAIRQICVKLSQLEADYSKVSKEKRRLEEASVSAANAEQATLSDEIRNLRAMQEVALSRVIHKPTILDCGGRDVNPHP